MFRTVIKIRKIQFTQFLHTSASKFFIRALPRYYMLQPILDILFYIALLSNKILVLFGLDFRAGNSKFHRQKIPARSDPVKDTLCTRRIVGVYRKRSALFSVPCLDPRYRFCKLSEIGYNLEFKQNTRKYKLVFRITRTE